MEDLKLVYDANHLVAAYMEARKGTTWKEAVQRYEINLLENILKTSVALRSGNYKTSPMTEFTLRERGHIRHIKAQHVSDRVVQRAFNDYVLVPRIRPLLIYDNGASLEGKGLSFSRKRFEIHIRKAFQEYGETGYILLMDFSKYFDNIQHEKALEMFRPYLNKEEYNLLKTTFKDFEIDVSHMDPEEYSTCMDRVFNAIEYAEKVSQEQKTGKRFMKKSVGIGNQSSQITGIFYPAPIDNYCKIVKGLKYYGRYMDDTYIILDSKEKLKRLYKGIEEQCQQQGIFVNRKKTHIHKITEWITFLKINYKLTKTGGLIRKIHNSTISRERRRLKKFQKLVSTGRMDLETVNQCYQSWRGSYRKYDSRAALHRMDNYFYKLFSKGGKEDGRKGSSGTANH